MKVIPISGVIGSDVTPAAVRSALDAAGGEAVELQIGSPGGGVFDGIEIRNLLSRYSGRVSGRIMGLCGSAASFIATACRPLTVETGGVYMLHNPAGGAIGDYRDMAKMRDILDSLAALLAGGYAERSGKPVPTVRAEMDAETWLYGPEIVTAGYADSAVETAAGGSAKASAITAARAPIEAAARFGRDSWPTDASARIAAYAGTAALRPMPAPAPAAPPVPAVAVGLDALHAAGWTTAQIVRCWKMEITTDEMLGVDRQELLRLLDRYEKALKR
jgi:ATP-dependent Clp protease, protease subunit